MFGLFLLGCVVRNETILDLIDLCYRSIDTPEAWQELVSALVHELRADAGDFVIEDYQSCTASPLGSVGFDPGFRVDYDDQYMGENGWINELKSLPIGRVFGNQHEPEDFEHSAYYNEWIRPQGFRYAMGALLEDGQNRAIHVGVLRHRKQRDYFNAAEARSMEKILPHMSRALKIRECLLPPEAAWDPVEALARSMDMPAILLDSDRRVLFLNEMAEDLLSRRTEFHLVGNRLRIWERTANDRFRDTISAACCLEKMAARSARSEVAVPRRNGSGPAILAEVIPLRSVAISSFCTSRCLVVLVDPLSAPKQASGRLMRAWNLTRTEEKLALALSGGTSTQEFADRSASSVGTVRWHLKNIQAKMGVDTLAGVVARVNGTLRGL